MLNREQNETLTRVGPGTPAGELLRRYWQPVALSREVPPNGAPLAVRLLGEDLVLFRDDKERIGLLALHCSHRGADLSYGRVEDGGLRCLYHGWLYDVRGRCLEQPGEPKGKSFADKVQHPAYPCVEAAGMILAYLGPGEPPLLPAYEFLTAPEDYVHAGKIYHECNYLQGNEGNIDPTHLSFLHAFKNPEGKADGYEVEGASFFSQYVTPDIEIEETDFGIRIHTARKLSDGRTYLRATNFILPNLSAFTGALADGYTVNWHVPIDDEHHWKYMITFTKDSPVNKAFIDKIFFGDEIDADYRPIRNRGNRYLQNRDIMKSWSYSGVGERPGAAIPSQDLLTTEGQGPIQDRTRERLGYGDKAIVAARLMLLRAIQELQAGKEPPNVVREPKDNRFQHLVVLSEVIPAVENWKSYWRKREETSRATFT
jgi:phenylpropionate dioxygenase-like ring-hydroxylating dioxygenase large terminal subunit